LLGLALGENDGRNDGSILGLSLKETEGFNEGTEKGTVASTISVPSNKQAAVVQTRVKLMFMGIIAFEHI